MPRPLQLDFVAKALILAMIFGLAAACSDGQDSTSRGSTASAQAGSAQLTKRIQVWSQGCTKHLAGEQIPIETCSSDDVTERADVRDDGPLAFCRSLTDSPLRSSAKAYVFGKADDQPRAGMSCSYGHGARGGPLSGEVRIYVPYAPATTFDKSSVFCTFSNSEVCRENADGLAKDPLHNAGSEATNTLASELGAGTSAAWIYVSASMATMADSNNTAQQLFLITARQLNVPSP